MSGFGHGRISEIDSTGLKKWSPTFLIATVSGRELLQFSQYFFYTAGAILCPQLHARVPSLVSYVSEDLKWWGAWDTTRRHKAKGHHIISRLEERGVERGSVRRSSLKRRERANVNKAKVGTERRVECIWAFPSAQTLSWTELKYDHYCDRC